MRHIVITCATAGLVLLSGCSSTAPSSPAPSTSPSATCAPITEQEVAALFTRWNEALTSKNPAKVAENYAERSILLPTLSNKPRLTAAEKEDYFKHFIEDSPSGTIDQRLITIGCNSAVDSGLYTFTFARTGAKTKARYTFTYEHVNGKWLITSHHSSMMPEK